MASDGFDLQQPSVITWVDSTSGLRTQGLPRYRQVLPACGVTGAQVLLSHHPLRRPRALAGKAYVPQSLGFDLVHHCHQRIRLSGGRDKQIGLLLPLGGELTQHDAPLLIAVTVAPNLR